MMFSPTPWRFKFVSYCGHTKEPWGDIIGADETSVAEGVYEKDAAAIISAVNPSPSAALERSEEKK